MVEFGEQLRRARELKGMTQQSLAEQLYVTRQAVSRWECGDRYPDLLTTKKISVILDVSLDDLLSENEMNKVVERNPVIEKPLINNIMIALYAFIVFSFAVTVVDIIIRFPLQSETIDYSDIQLVVINLASLIIQIGVFVYGLINAVRGILSPKRMGVVATVYFATMALTGSDAIFRSATWQLLSLALLLIVPCIIGMISAFQFFIKARNESIFRYLIYSVSAWGVFRLVLTNYTMIRYAGQFVSMNNALNILLKISIYILLIYQVHTLYKKRKRVFSTQKDS